jgi:hypothetical protein
MRILLDDLRGVFIEGCDIKIPKKVEWQEGFSFCPRLIGREIYFKSTPKFTLAVNIFKFVWIIVIKM